MSDGITRKPMANLIAISEMFAPSIDGIVNAQVYMVDNEARKSMPLNAYLQLR